MWEYLYAYEVYNSLLTNKRDVCQDMKINGAGLEKGGQYSNNGPASKFKRTLMWEATCTIDTHTRTHYMSPLTYIKVSKFYHTDKNKNQATFAFNLKDVKENELILLSEEQLNLPNGSDDIKKILNLKLLKELLTKDGIMLGLVQSHQKKNDYLRVSVDDTKCDLFKTQGDIPVKMWAYIVD